MLDDAAQPCPTPLVGLDARLDVRLWNRAAEHLLGWSADEVLGRRVPGIPHGEMSRFEARLERVLRGDAVDGAPDVRTHRDGHAVAVLLSAGPARTADGSVIGVLQYLRPALAGADRATGSTAAAVEPLELLEYTSDAFYELDSDGRFVYLNSEAERLLSRDRSELLGTPMLGAIPGLLGSAEGALVSRAIDEARPVPFELMSPQLDRWIEGTVHPARRGGVAVFFRDISARKRDEDRLRFLSEAAEALASSLDSEQTLQRIARLAVPFLADVCMVDLLDERGRIRRVAGAGTAGGDDDPTEPAGASPSAESEAIAIVLRTGEPVLRSPAGMDGPRRDDAAHPVTAMMVVPMFARGRLQGTLTFLASGASGRRFDEDDMLFAQEVAARAALAVDNALLYEAAQEASQAKSNFMAVMSHELRTPLTAVIGYADLLDAGIAGSLSAKQSEYVSRIRRGARMQLQIVEEVLTYARADTGRAQPVVGSLDLWDLVRTTAALMKPSADVKRLSFDVDLPDAPAPIESDAAKLRQVVLNLLGNAVKFTRSGGITVRGWARADRYALEVADTGIGIPEEHFERIYEPFWQAEQATTRTFGGSGLGLAVVQRLVDLLGGEVSVRSSPRGTTFRIELPFAIRRPRRAREPAGVPIVAG